MTNEERAQYSRRFSQELASIEDNMTRDEMLQELGVNPRMRDYLNRATTHGLAVRLARSRLLHESPPGTLKSWRSHISRWFR